MINPYDLLKRIEYLERKEQAASPGLFLAEHKTLGGHVLYVSFTQPTLSGNDVIVDPSTFLLNGVVPVLFSSINGIPYAILDGATSYFFIDDDPLISITGLESIFHADVQGLTVGGWLYLDDATPASESTLIAKWLTAGNQRSFRLYVDTDGLVKFGISVNGTAEVEIANETALEAGRWYFIGGSFVPGASMLLLVDTEEVEETDSVPASIFDSTADVTIGAIDGGTLRLDGGVASCFLYANQHSLDELRRLYEAGRFFFQQDD